MNRMNAPVRPAVAMSFDMSGSSKSKDGTIDRYPSVWLRDNCQCSSCFDPSSRQRKLLLRNLDVEIRPRDVTFDDETKEVVKYSHNNHICMTNTV